MIRQLERKAWRCRFQLLLLLSWLNIKMLFFIGFSFLLWFPFWTYFCYRWEGLKLLTKDSLSSSEHQHYFESIYVWPSLTKRKTVCVMDNHKQCKSYTMLCGSNKLTFIGAMELLAFEYCGTYCVYRVEKWPCHEHQCSCSFKVLLVFLSLDFPPSMKTIILLDLCILHFRVWYRYNPSLVCIQARSRLHSCYFSLPFWDCWPPGCSGRMQFFFPNVLIMHHLAQTFTSWKARWKCRPIFSYLQEKIK